MSKLMYCITHEAWAYPDYMDYEPMECVWVTSAPDELDMSDGWVDNLPVPDADELAEMDKNAIILASDFTLFGEL